MTVNSIYNLQFKNMFLHINTKCQYQNRKTTGTAGMGTINALLKKR